MTFLSPLYALFLVILLIIYWSVRSRFRRSVILLIFSVAFYLLTPLHQWYYFPLLMILTIVNYIITQRMGINSDSAKKAQDHNLSNEEWQITQSFWNVWRLQILIIGISLNVLILLAFKYATFLLKLTSEQINISITMPLGLSFFAFECIAYLVDVYRGAPIPKNIIDFAAYKLFFPKLISGPITRYHHFAGEYENLKFPKINQITEGVWLIACGAVKKGLLADNFGKVVDLIFANTNLQRAGSIDLWIGILAYGLQLYLDFSGYVDMARGSAILLGFNLPENFNFPYFTTNIAEFWRRWHITLGDWLRNYVYFPLGGSRKGLIRTCINLLIIMLIAGIWHGSSWGYVFWGALHGIALIIHRLNEALSQHFTFLKRLWSSFLGVLSAWLITQFMIFISWIFFRLPNFKDSMYVIEHLWGHNGDIQFAQKVYEEAIMLSPLQLTLIMVIVIILMGFAYILQRGLKLQLNWPIKLLLAPICLYAVWLLSPEDSLPYIYFDF